MTARGLLPGGEKHFRVTGLVSLHPLSMRCGPFFELRLDAAYFFDYNNGPSDPIVQAGTACSGIPTPANEECKSEDSASSKTFWKPKWLLMS